MKYIKKRSVKDRRAKEEERKIWRYQEYHDYRALLIRVLHERDCAAVITEIAIQFAPGCNELKFQSTLNKDLIPHLQFVLHPYIPKEVHRNTSKCEPDLHFAEDCVRVSVRRSRRSSLLRDRNLALSSFLPLLTLLPFTSSHPPSPYVLSATFIFFFELFPSFFVPSHT